MEKPARKQNSFTLEQFKARSVDGQLPELLGMEMTEIGEGQMTAKLVVDQRHLRPGGIMNGGVSLVLIETLGSFSSYLYLNPETQNAFGIQVTANHLSIARPGDVLIAKSSAVHIGRTTQVWDVQISHQDGKLISSGRITMLVTALPPKKDDKS